MSANILLALRLLLTLTLYVFLGWALYTLWKDLKRTSQASSITLVPEIILKVLSDEHEQANSYRKEEILIGRDPLSDLHLEDETISARHARFSYHHDQWWVDDLNSKNGTYINGEPVHEAMVVTDGDQLQCGKMVLSIHFPPIT